VLVPQAEGPRPTGQIKDGRSTTSTRRPLPGVPPGPERACTVLAGKPACHQGGLDIFCVVTYDVQSGASGYHPEGPLRFSAKRMGEGVPSF
jgi:hypothetical protein